MDVGDDGICMKGGAGAAALKDGPCDNILIEDNTVFHAHGGFVIGSEFSGGMVNIVVRNNTFSGTDTGLRFKSAPERGGKTENIWISDIYMSDIQGDDAMAAATENFLPDFQDIHIARVTCRDARVGVKASGTLQMIHDITLEDCLFFYTEEASQVDDAGMLQLKNVRFETYR